MAKMSDVLPPTILVSSGCPGQYCPRMAMQQPSPQRLFVSQSVLPEAASQSGLRRAENTLACIAMYKAIGLPRGTRGRQGLVLLSWCRAEGVRKCR
jgi:hypothetical protein